MKRVLVNDKAARAEFIRAQCLREKTNHYDPQWGLLLSRERERDKKLPAIDFFWQATGLVFFSAEGDFPREQAQLASSLRSQMVGRPHYEGKSVTID